MNIQPWYGDKEVFNAFLSEAIEVPNAIYEYPWDEEKHFIDPDHVPTEWKNFPIIRAAVAYKILLKKSNDRMKGILC